MVRFSRTARVLAVFTRILKIQVLRRERASNRSRPRSIPSQVSCTTSCATGTVPHVHVGQAKHDTVPVNQFHEGLLMPGPQQLNEAGVVVYSRQAGSVVRSHSHAASLCLTDQSTITKSQLAEPGVPVAVPSVGLLA